MPFLLTKQNVEDLKTDAKVIGSCPYRSSNRRHSWQPDLWAEQRRIDELSSGESLVTSGIQFDAKCGIITKPPIWEGGQRKEDLKQACCYDTALRLANRRRCKSSAFPLLSADGHGFPKDLAIRTAISTLREFLDKYEMTVYLSVREPSALALFDAHYGDILEVINRELSPDGYSSAEDVLCEAAPCIENIEDYGVPYEAPDTWPMEDSYCAPAPKASPKPIIPRKLHNLMAEQEESFSQRLFRLIDEKGLKDPDVYKKANLDRRLFSKIRSHTDYQPSKQTALALALALELNLDQTRDFIGKAGYTLSRSNKTDIILEYFIQEGDYDIYEINQILFAFDQPLIGG